MSDKLSPEGDFDRSTASPRDEGGLRAPSHLKGWRKWWWWFDFIVLVKLARLRFIGVLLVIGVVITQWDLLVAYYDKWTRPAAADGGQAGEYEWFCPMHPSVVRNNPKEKCPICFMPLSKRKKGSQTAEALPAGVVSRVQLTPYRMVLAGVQTSEVGYVPLAKEITAVGYVEFNERGQRSISARFNARVDELFVSETGKMVAEGDALASMYSPELIVATQSLVDAKKAGNRESLASTRRRLQLLGISDDQIDDILAAGTANTHLKIRSPIKGHVIRKYVREGQYVQEGSPLFDVADLSTVWIQAQIYEDDLLFLPESLAHNGGGAVAEAFPVTATTRALPNEEFHGMLTFVYPHVDQQTRTVTVRFELDNPSHKLRPGSTATVTLKIPPERWALVSGLQVSGAERSGMLKQGKLLAVPESAVIDTGRHKVIYRESEPGVFEGVTVTLAPKMSGPDDVPYFPVLAGLEPGARIVTTGSFLVDAETRLNPAAGSIYFGGSGGSGSGRSSPTTVRPTTPEDPDSRRSASLSQLSAADRQAAEAQQFCPILTQNRLGSMGPPVKLVIQGEPIFLCCAGCREQALADPNATLAKAKELRQRLPSGEPQSLISKESKEEQEFRDAFLQLTPADRLLAESQRYCAVESENRLGSMGSPVKLMIDGQAIFLCCEGCRETALENKAETIEKARQLRSTQPPHAVEPDSLDPKIAAALAKLDPSDRAIAEAQQYCAVLEKNRLGTMGVPVKIVIDDQPVFLCCPGCRDTALKDPQKTLAKARDLAGRRHD